MISAIVTIKELLQNDCDEKIAYVRNSKAGGKDDYPLKKDREYNIPGYQREIRWNTNNIQVLLDDLKDNSKFLGYVLMSTEDDVHYNIIDGQQRLTVIFMLLDAIKRKDAEMSYATCFFNNESFADIKMAIEKDFYQEESEKQAECKKKDILNQYERLVDLSTYVNKAVLEMDKDTLGKIWDHLCDSDINLTIQRVGSKIDEKRACVDYFIDINNKNVRLDYIDILKAYAFKENFNVIIERWVDIPKKIKSLSIDFNYPVEDMYLHYLLCVANEECGYGIKGLTDELKLSKDAFVGDTKYEAGVDVEVLINSRNFYLTMLQRIEKFIEFAAVVANDKTSYGEDFAVYINPKGDTISDESKQNYFTIINGIMRSSDVVPKLLLMKYFVYVVLNKDAQKEDYDLIYNIGIMTSFFTAGPGNAKNRNAYSSIVLKEKWKNDIDKQSIKLVKDWRKKIVFNKEIKHKNTYTEFSGQYLARRVHSILYSVSYNESAKKIKIKKDAFKRFSISPEYNDEHFLINQSYTIDFNYKKKNEKYNYPDGIKSIVSHLGNYLFIAIKINGKLGNKTIKDKILLVEEYLAKGKTVFEDELSKIKYNVAKDVFTASGCKCPTEKELKSCSTLDEAKAKLDDYYTNCFTADYADYIEKLKNVIATKKLCELNMQ